jgi:hypothetical protein
VVCGSMLYVVADDAHCLAVFDLDEVGPGQLISLIEGDLPGDAKQRKKVKPDFEILLALPEPKLPDGRASRLLAIGSGSTARRMRGAVIDLRSIGEPAKVRLLDLKPLFSAVAPLVPEINLEGAVLHGEHLLLFNRGTMTHPTSHILEVPLAALLEGKAVSVRLCAALTLPTCAGVPLTVTDAFRLNTDEPNGDRILLSAVAEATTDSYADGALLGAAIVELNADLNIRTIQPLEPILKVEGLSARSAADGVHLLCVTDADDPDRASALYGCVFNA